MVVLLGAVQLRDHGLDSVDRRRLGRDRDTLYCFPCLFSCFYIAVGAERKRSGFRAGRASRASREKETHLVVVLCVVAAHDVDANHGLQRLGHVAFQKMLELFFFFLQWFSRRARELCVASCFCCWRYGGGATTALLLADLAVHVCRFFPWNKNVPKITQFLLFFFFPFPLSAVSVLRARRRRLGAVH